MQRRRHRYGIRPDATGRQHDHGAARAQLADRSQKAPHHGAEGCIKGFLAGAAAQQLHDQAAQPGACQSPDKRPQPEKERRQEDGPGNGPHHAGHGAGCAGAVPPGVHDLYAHFQHLAQDGQAQEHDPEPDIQGPGGRVQEFPQHHQQHYHPVGGQAKDVEQQDQPQQDDERIGQAERSQRDEPFHTLLLDAGIVHAHGLAFAAGQAVALHQFHTRRHQDLVTQPLGDGFLQALQAAHVFHEVFVANLHLHAHNVADAVVLQQDAVILPHFGEGHDDLLDLHGIDIDTLDDEHVVRAAQDAVDAAVMTAAGTFPGQETGQVAGAVTQDGHALTAQAGHDQFADLAVGHGLAGPGIHDLRQVRILPDMQAVLVLAFKGHARAVHLGEAVRVVGLHVEEFFDTAPEFHRIGLGPHHGDAQGKVARIFAHIAQMLAKDERIGRQDMGDRGPEVLGQLDLAARVAGAGGDGHAAQALGAEMDPQAPGEQTVTGHVLEHIITAYAYHVQAAGHEISPAVDIVLRMADGHRTARGSTGAVHAHDLAARHAQKPRGILVPQILLGGEGNAPDIVQRRDAPGRHAGFIQTAAIELALAHMGHRGPETRQLGVFDLIPAPQFRCIENFHVKTLLLLVHLYKRPASSPLCAHPQSRPKQPASIISPYGARNCPCPCKNSRFGPRI